MLVKINLISDSFLQPDLLVPAVVGTLMFTALVIAMVLFFQQYSRAKNKFNWERQQFKQALLQTEVEIRNLTLNAVSRELHDNLGQIASLIKINLNLVSKDLSPEDREKIEESTTLIKQLIADIKSMSQSLNSERLDKIGLAAAVKQEAERINRTGQVAITFSTNGETTALPADTEMFLFRICQEALHNILKHAKAKTAEVIMQYAADQLSISVNDNGQGFSTDLTAAESPTGSGLRNIRKRCEMIGAGLTIESVIDAGTRITINLPIKMIPNENKRFR